MSIKSSWGIGEHAIMLPPPLGVGLIIACCSMFHFLLPIKVRHMFGVNLKTRLLIALPVALLASYFFWGGKNELTALGQSPDHNVETTAPVKTG